MAKLSASDRRALPQSDYALPGKHYPIEDENHARAALSMEHNATPAQQAEISAKVHSKYPDIGKPSADILMRRKKKPEAPQAPAPKPTADILMRRKK